MPPVMAQHPPSASKLAANILNFIAEVDLADAAAPLDGLGDAGCRDGSGSRAGMKLPPKRKATPSNDCSFAALRGAIVEHCFNVSNRLAAARPRS
jgi:hypothetical protein